MKRFSPSNLINIFKKSWSITAFFRDIYAGLSVGVLSIPLAIAFAIASGVRPEQGLYTAVVAGFVAALFGGCRFQVSGPVGTFIVLIFSTIQNYGYEGLVLAMIMGGLILVVMGIARFGSLIKFIPYPVVIGFTSGVAVVLAVGQIPDLFGLHIASFPKVFVTKCLVIFQHLYLFNLPAILISIVTVIIVLVAPRYVKNIPGTLLAIVVTSVLVLVFKMPVDTIKDRFGLIPSGAPPFSLPYFQWSLLFELFPTAFAIALLSGIESLLSSMVADGMTGTRHNSNKELIGQGLSNISSAFFQGIPSAGSLSRSAANIRNGAETCFSAIVSAALLAGILVFSNRLIGMIPLASLAAILMIVAYNISDWRHFTKLFRSPASDVVVLLTTFFLTVFVNLISALEIGIILATFLFVDNASKQVKSHFLRAAKDSREMDEIFSSSPKLLDDIPSEIEVFELYGSLFFAAVDNFKKAFNSMNSTPKVLIIRLRYVPSIDASGIHALEDILLHSRKRKTTLFLSGASESVFQTLRKSGFTLLCGEQFIFKTFEEAFHSAKQLCAETGEFLSSEKITHR